MPESGARVSLDPTGLAHGGRRILGSKMGSARPAVDVPRLVDLYRERRLELDGLISGRYRLEEIGEAVAATARGGVLRNVIMLEGGA